MKTTALLGLVVPRLLALGSLVAGCTVVVPNLNVQTVAVVAPHGSGPSLAPFSAAPSPPPSPSPVVGSRTFFGNGPLDRVGLVQLPRGRVIFHIRFSATIADSGHFSLQLLDQEGMLVNALLDQSGSFETSLDPEIEIADSYFLSIPAADGSWTIEVDPQ